MTAITESVTDSGYPVFTVTLPDLLAAMHLDPDYAILDVEFNPFAVTPTVSFITGSG